MSKAVKIILALVLFLFILNILFKIVVKTASNKALQVAFESDKVDASKSLAESGEAVSPDPASRIPAVDLWKEYVFSDADFSIRFPSEPKIYSDPTENLQSIFYRSQAYVPGENIQYSVVYYNDTSPNIRPAKEVESYIFSQYKKGALKILFGNSIKFTSKINTTYEGYQTMTYIVDAPKKIFGTLIGVGNKVYDIRAECLYCTAVPEFDNFVNSFRLINI